MSDNIWYKNGELPPVGTIVEFCNKKEGKEHICMDDWRNGDKLEILAIRKVHMRELPIVFNIRDQTASAVIMNFIKPIKTERELAIEQMSKDINLLVTNHAMIKNTVGLEDSILAKLYDAGCRKNEAL